MADKPEGEFSRNQFSFPVSPWQSSLPSTFRSSYLESDSMAVRKSVEYQEGKETKELIGVDISILGHSDDPPP